MNKLFLVTAKGRITVVRAPDWQTADKLIRKRQRLATNIMPLIQELKPDGSVEIIATLIPRE